MNEYLTASQVQPPPRLEQLPKALLKAQKKLMKMVVTKTSENEHFHNKYAELSNVIDAVIPLLNEEGITVIQLPTTPPYEGSLALTTTLLHESGESVSGTLVIPLEKANAQGVGSAISYGRRYSLASVLGLKQKDDDGEAAVDATKREQTESRPQPNAKPAWKFPNQQPKPAAAPQRGKAKLFPSVGDAEGGKHEEA